MNENTKTLSMNEKHCCPSCGKELQDNPYPEINYLCSVCKNKAESTPEFGEKP